MSLNLDGLYDFSKFILSRTYGFNENMLDKNLIATAAKLTVADSKYHFEINADEVVSRICANRNELPVYLHRLGRTAFLQQKDHPILPHLHWAMRELCNCEIYFSSEIDEGLLIIHGLGTVIGSRNRIGKGFTIYQGCTIGHITDGGKGCMIGDDVTMYVNSQILGELTIGDNAVIGSNSLVLKDVPAGSVAKGSPAGFTPLEKTGHK